MPRQSVCEEMREREHIGKLRGKAIVDVRDGVMAEVLSQQHVPNHIADAAARRGKGIGI